MTKTILVADDDPGNVSVTESLLKERGYTVLIAVDGEEALKKALAFKPHLILLDIMMPKVDGTDVAMALRENPKTKDIPIFFLTAVVTPEDHIDSIGSANVIFPKPVNFGALLNKIREVIGQP